MDPRLRIRRYTLLALLLLFAVAHIVAEWNATGDFLIYYQAAQDVLQYKNIFVEEYGPALALPYYGSPVLAVALVPFTFLSYPVAAAIWKLLNLALLYRIWVRLESFVSVRRLPEKVYFSFILITFFCVSFVLYRNFHLAQFTVFLLFACREGYHQIQKGRNIPGAVFIAAGILCKILPIVLLPYLLYRRFFRGALWTLIAVVAMLWLPALFLGWKHTMFLNQQWWHSINPSNAINVFDVSTEDIHGVASWLATLFIDGIGIDEDTLSIRRHIVDLNPDLVVIIIQFVRISLIGFTLFFLRTMPFRAVHNKEQILWEMGYLLLVAPLIFPQQRLYAFLFFLPAIFYLNYRMALQFLRSGRRFPRYFFLYAFAILVFNLELLVGNFREYYWHYKTVTYCALVILFIYAKYRPQSAGKTQMLS